jgi:hypothetical protein
MSLLPAVGSFEVVEWKIFLYSNAVFGKRVKSAMLLIS